MKCGKQCEVYSRVCGYHRPTTNWNKGKTAEWNDRVEFEENVAMSHENKISDSMIEKNIISASCVAE